MSATSHLGMHGEQTKILSSSKGVAVGSSADLVIQPWGAILIGILAGTLSVVGYVYITPMLERRIGLDDTCGVHNLHGMPGIPGSVVSIIFTETHHQSWMPHAKGSMAAPQAAPASPPSRWRTQMCPSPPAQSWPDSMA